MSQSYNPAILEKEILGLFMKMFADSPPSYVDRIATVQNSMASSEKYGWIGNAPTLTELADDTGTVYTPLSDADYTLTNKEYTGGFTVKRSDLEDDQVSGIMMRVQELAAHARRFPNKLLIDKLVAGTTDTDFTAEAFFNDSHTARGKAAGSLDNLLAGSGTSTANIGTDINAGLVQLLQTQNEAGEPFVDDITRVAIVCNPLLRKPMLENLEATIISNTSNVQPTGIVWDLILSARLADTNDWYMLNVGSPVRPLIYQDRMAATIEQLASPEAGDAAFDSGRYKWKVRMRSVVGFSMWQLANKTVNA